MKLGDSPKRNKSRHTRGMRTRNRGGYTLVEVLITMGVTATLLVAAMVTFSGRIARTQFTQSVRALDARINEVFNEVASGNFTDDNFSCVVVAGAPTFSAGTNEQGTNSTCIYIGKVIQFGVQDADCTVSAPDECDTVGILSVAGRRTLFSGGIQRNTSTYDEANLRIIDALNESFVTGYGLSVSRVVAGGNDIAAVAAFLSLGQNNNAVSTNGVQKLVILPVNGTALGSDSNAATLNANVEPINESDTDQPITVCLASADRRAAIIINGENRQASTDVLFDNAVPGECS